MSRSRILILLVLVVVAAVSAIGITINNAIKENEKAAAQEEVVAIEVPIEMTQEKAKLYLSFSLAEDLPKEWKDAKAPAMKILEFDHSSGEWSTEAVQVETLDYGPLFYLTGKNFPSFAPADCPINTYFPNTPGNVMSLKPLCTIVPDEVTANIELGLANCTILPNEDLDCTRVTDDGSLSYRLNAARDEFQFVVSGNYRFEYAEWIMASLEEFGFTDLDSKYPESIIPGALNTIKK